MKKFQAEYMNWNTMTARIVLNLTLKEEIHQVSTFTHFVQVPVTGTAIVSYFR